MRFTVEEHKRLHTCCPTCDEKSSITSTTNDMWLDNKNRVIRDPNRAQCSKCGWEGMVTELRMDISNAVIDSFSEYVSIDNINGSGLSRREKRLIQKFMEWIKDYKAGVT